MKFSENWLRELVDIDVDRAALIHRLTMAGLEVDGWEALGEGLDGVVVGEIVDAQGHPNADRLQICDVDVGGDATVQIVCGAPNARVGLKAPLATIGTRLPGGLVIKKAKLRGVESFGMLCSARELGVDNDASGLMELPGSVANGTPVARCLGLPDASIDVGLTPNRPDCLGMWGLAHDVAAILGAATRLPQVAAVEVTSTAIREVRLDAGPDCPRYTGRVITGIDPRAPTPAWLAARLHRAGLRPVSVIVDVTNYVMLETGQPLHAFDNDHVEGPIVVRHAREGETLALLNGQEARLDDGFLVIADATGPLGAAGVMGGMASRVTDATRDIFLESAHFAAAAIMGKARKLGLHTDASHRFERGVDAQGCVRALERASALLLELAGGKAGPIVVAELPDALPTRAPVPLRRERLARVLGLGIDDAEVLRILEALDMHVVQDPDGWQATPPDRRFDIECEEDLIEEVARIHGYERIPVHAPSGQLKLETRSEARSTPLAIAHQLVGRDYLETINMAFLGNDTLHAWGMDVRAVALANPLNADLAVMRPSLLPGLVEALRHNLARQLTRVRLFERGHVFTAAAEPGSPPCEVARVAWVACGDADAEQWGVTPRALDFHDIRGDLDALVAATGEPALWRVQEGDLPAWLHPGRSGRVYRDGRVVGVIGMLHPRCLAALDLARDVYVAELDLDALCERRLPHAAPVARFPSVRRDIAVEVPVATRWADVEACVRKALGPRLKTLRLFDQYQGGEIAETQKSLAIGLILQDELRTLVDEDANRCVADAVAALEHDCNARLRG